MHLFLLRHGEAQLFANSDPERALTSVGYHDTNNILAQSKADLQRVTKIIASPYLRAQQTATLASELLELPLETSELLTPESRLSNVTQMIESLQGEVPLLVTHQPLVGSYVDWLCGLAPGRHIMGTSALACIEAEVVAGSCGELLWLHQPSMSL
jgi:phosphohistidine phosphatase